MSTRDSIKYGGGYHLYQDCMDDGEGPLYLEITSCEFEAGATPNPWVNVQIPRRVAIALGLISPGAAAAVETTDVSEHDEAPPDEQK